MTAGTNVLPQLPSFELQSKLQPKVIKQHQPIRKEILIPSPSELERQNSTRMHLKTRYFFTRKQYSAHNQEVGETEQIIYTRW